MTRLLGLAAAFLAACGGGNDSTGAAPEEPVAETQASFVEPEPEDLLANLFVAGADGLLRPREVPLSPSPTTRGRAEALARRLVGESGTFPPGVRVLDVFVSGRGVAVVDFTLDLLEGHPGGLTAEELTVYSLSHTLVENLPAIAEVRLLVEGRETETLAGHLDLRSGFARAPDRLLRDVEATRP